MSNPTMISSRQLMAACFAPLAIRAIGMVALFAIVTALGPSAEVESFLAGTTYGNAFNAIQSSLILPFLISKLTSCPSEIVVWLRRIRSGLLCLGVLLSLTHIVAAKELSNMLSSGQSAARLAADMPSIGLFLLALMISIPNRAILIVSGRQAVANLIPALSVIVVTASAIAYTSNVREHLMQIQAGMAFVEAILLHMYVQHTTPDFDGHSWNIGGLIELFSSAKWLSFACLVQILTTSVDLPAYSLTGPNGVSAIQTGTRLPFLISFALSAGIGSLVGSFVFDKNKALHDDLLSSSIKSIMRHTIPIAGLCAIAMGVLSMAEFSWSSALPPGTFLVAALTSPMIPLVGVVSLQSRFLDINNLQKESLIIQVFALILRVFTIFPFAIFFGLSGVIIAILLTNLATCVMQAHVLSSNIRVTR